MRLLSDADQPHRLCFPSGQPPLDRPVHDAVDLVPGQMQDLRCQLLTRVPQPFDRQALKQQREPTPGFCPGQLHRSRSVLRAVCSRRLGVKYRLVLARVQMPPAPLRLMVVQDAFLFAFGAFPGKPIAVRKEDVHLILLKLQVDSIHKPGARDPENLLVRLPVLNGRFLVRRTSDTLPSAWAEDRATLESDPRTGSGAKTERGVHRGTPFLPRLSPPRYWHQSDKSRRSGGWPPGHRPTRNPEFPLNIVPTMPTAFMVSR